MLILQFVCEKQGNKKAWAEQLNYIITFNITSYQPSNDNVACLAMILTLSPAARVYRELFLTTAQSQRY